MKKLILPVFILLALVQWLVPAKIIVDRETILRKGTAYRFLTQPIDPSNPFIGRYISLNFKEAICKVNNSTDFERGQPIYVLLKTNKDGYAKVTGIVKKEPAAATAFVKAKVSYVYYDSTIGIDFAFDKYYMDEYKAPKAEDAYRKANTDSTKKTYALVKIWKGRAVTENVFINNKPIQELIH